MSLRIAAAIFSVTLLMAACSNPNETSTYGTSQQTTVTKSDGSTVETKIAADGTRTEVRTFPSGDVLRITRTTRPGGKRTATVELRDGSKSDLDNESDIEKALDATGDAIAAAARKTLEVSKDVGKTIGDKAEDAADKTVDTTKDVGKKIGKEAKKAARKVKDKID